MIIRLLPSFLIKCKGEKWNTELNVFISKWAT